MTDYTNTDPSFAETISIPEASDPAHADIINTPTKQLLQNDLVLKEKVESLPIVKYIGQDDYDALPDDKLEDGVIYMITSGGGVTE